jgi:hypothetical protein
MRRSLVQGDDVARHPFLQSLPRHVRHGRRKDPVRSRNRVDEREAAAARKADLMVRLRQWKEASELTAQDVKDFLLAYCACFVAVMAFVS